MRDHALTRRDFVKSAAGLAAAPAWAQGASPSPARGAPAQGAASPTPAQNAPQAAAPAAAPQASSTRPRISCTSWAFHGFNAGASPEPAIDMLGQLRFEGIELICSAPAAPPTPRR